MSLIILKILSDISKCISLVVADYEIIIVDNCHIFSDLKVNSDFKLNCILHINQTSTKKIIVWGESHARAWESVFIKIANFNNYNLFIISHPGCPPVVDTKRTDGIVTSNNCYDINEKNKILESIINLKPDVVILVAK